MPDGSPQTDKTVSIRRHLILVPGFVGFDAIGQLRYYAGVAQGYQNWRARNSATNTAVHYFDNFPTASVAQRAERLHVYLAEKLALGQISMDDEITLLGHSTGGLDIRALLALLHAKPNDLAPRNDAPTQAAGSSRAPAQGPITNRDLRRVIHRVVFMSVPHFGTNIADLAVRFAKPIQEVIHDVNHALSANKLFATRWLTPGDILRKHPSDLVVAIADALEETDGVARTPANETAALAQRAAEREARFELRLWLEHMQDDFGALCDLRSATPDLLASLDKQDPLSPAHYDTGQRAQELRDYKGLAAKMPPIRTLSFATHADPFATSRLFAPLLAAFTRALWVAPLATAFGVFVRLLDALVIPRVGADLSATGGLLGLLGVAPRLVYTFMHQACGHASGPFRSSTSLGVARVRSRAWRTFLKAKGIDALSNDGVVNTLSMLYPFDADSPDPDHKLRFVQADHADVIGHYTRLPPAATLPSGRQFVAYDIFPSESGFTSRSFAPVWVRVFKFAFGTPAAPSRSSR